MDSDHLLLGWHTDVYSPVHRNGRYANSASNMHLYALQLRFVAAPRLQSDGGLRI